MSHFKQSIALPIFVSDDFDLVRLVDQAAEVGFDGVELWLKDEHFDAVVERIQERGIALAAWVGHDHDDIAWGIDTPDRQSQIVEQLHEHIELAAKLGVSGLTCLSGSDVTIHGGQPGEPMTDAVRQTTIERCVSCVGQLAQTAQQHSITLNIEMLNDRVDHPNYVLCDVDIVAEIVQQIDSPNVRMLYDIYHAAMQRDLDTAGVIEQIKQHAPLIGHYHVAGKPGRGNPDAQQELDYQAIVQTIASLGYTGYVGHEFEPNGDLRAALEQAHSVCTV